jgi:subtilase family serine protease
MFGAPLDASQTGGEAPDVVSASFGACEALQMFFQGKTAAVSIMESVLASAVAAGVSYLVATGDSGSSACLHALSFLPLPPDPAETVLSAQYPSTSAWVTAVGGTNLTLDDGNEIVSSGVWNDQAYELTTPQYLAGTGGTSTMVARPWYQASGVPAGSMRVVPDVAAFADALPGYSILGPSPSPAPVPDPGVWQPVGGTSAATPLLAGATLLLDQLAMQRGQPTLGFWNPLLYTLASGGTSSILDITLGTDDLFGVGCCSAATGFDLASGWGSARRRAGEPGLGGGGVVGEGRGVGDVHGGGRAAGRTGRVVLVGSERRRDHRGHQHDAHLHLRRHGCRSHVGPRHGDDRPGALGDRRGHGDRVERHDRGPDRVRGLNGPTR